MKAEGLPTTFEEAFGPVPPAEEDVFQHPALVEEFARKDVDRLNGARHFQFPNLTSKWEGQPDLGKAADFRQMPEPARTQDEEAAVARELLAMLEPQSRRFDALAEAFRRPRWHWGADVESVVHRACMFKSLGLFAKLRATLRLAAGQPDLAAEDVHELIVLEKQFAAHPGSAVSHLILLELDRQTSRAIWEGVKRRAWTDEQLAGFQSELTPLDMGRAFMDLFPGEVAFAVVQSRAMLADPSLLEKAMEDVEAMERLANSDQERGWWEQLNEQFGKWVVKAMPLGWKMRPAAWRLAWMRELYVGMREAPLNRLAAARMACERVSEPELFRQQWEHMVDRATDGETNDRPERTVRIAGSRSATSRSLATKPTCPSASDSRTNARSCRLVTKTTFAVEPFFLTRAAAAMPLSPGIAMSSTSRSGPSRSVDVTTEMPSLTAATTSNSLDSSWTRLSSITR